MVLHNSLDYGFNGYQVPPMPRATRSARRNGTCRSRVDDKQMHAFNLLASVAGNLLLERNPPTFSDTPTVKGNGVDVYWEKLFESFQLTGNVLISKLRFAGHDQDCSLKEYFSSREEYSSRFVPDVVISYATMNTSTSKIVVAENLTKQKAIEMENLVNEVGFATHTKSCGHNLDGGNGIKVNDKSEKVMSGADIATFRSSDPVVCNWNPHLWIGSENGFKLPLSKDHGLQHPCPASQEVVVRDDCNNSFGCIYPTTSRNTFRKAPCIRGHRIRKILASKNWKLAAKYGAERPKTSGYKRQFNFNKRNSYKNRRSQMNIPFKKRKLFDGCFSYYNGRRLVERISDSNESARESSAHGKSSLVAGHQGDSRGLRSAEDGYGGSEHYYWLWHTCLRTLTGGKKVRDDNKTLIQIGIFRDNQDECLGFTLEPHSSKTPSSFCHGEPPSTFPSSSTLEPINECPSNPTVDHPGYNSTLLLETHTAKVSNSTDTAREPVPSLADTPVEER